MQPLPIPQGKALCLPCHLVPGPATVEQNEVSPERTDLRCPLCGAWRELVRCEMVPVLLCGDFVDGFSGPVDLDRLPEAMAEMAAFQDRLLSALQRAGAVVAPLPDPRRHR